MNKATQRFSTKSTAAKTLSGKKMFFVTYGINYRGAFETEKEAQRWVRILNPIKINGYTASPAVVELDATIYDGVAHGTKYYANAPIGTCLYFEGEIDLEDELLLLGEEHPLYSQYWRGYCNGQVDDGISRKNPYVDKKEREAWEIGYSSGGIQAMLDE